MRRASVPDRLDRLVGRGHGAGIERTVAELAAVYGLHPAEVRAEWEEIEAHALVRSPLGRAGRPAVCRGVRPPGGGAVGGGHPDHRDGGDKPVTRVAVRLTKLEAAVPRPVTRAAYDLSRLTADQLERTAELRERVDAVGLSGLTDGEVDELAWMSEILLAPEPPEPPGHVP